MKLHFLTLESVLESLLVGCDTKYDQPPAAANALKPVVISEPTKYYTDDPAFWIHPTDRTKSLVVGTDKNSDGALYVYNLDGKIVNRVEGLKRPNNVDIAYGFSLGGRPTE